MMRREETNPDTATPAAPFAHCPMNVRRFGISLVSSLEATACRRVAETADPGRMCDREDVERPWMTLYALEWPS